MSIVRKSKKQIINSPMRTFYISFARQGKARQGKARQGKARQGKYL
jgi:hypothetical protein